MGNRVGYPYYGNGGWVILDSGAASGPTQHHPESLVINGRGYTQVLPRQADRSDSGNGTSAGAGK